MAFSGGVFSRLYNWVTEQASSPIEISKLDAQEEDFATGLSNCILRDGTGLPTAATDWNGKKITNLGAAATTGDALSRGAAAVVSTLSITEGAVISGTYTPTLTAIANIAASTSAVCHYMRMGAEVIVYGSVVVRANSESSTTRIQITLPIASNFAVSGNAWGYGHHNEAAVDVYVDTATDKVQCDWLSDTLSSRGLYFSFMYTII
jgi:hypothetical protein